MKTKVEFGKYSLSAMYVNGHNIINPFGFETSTKNSSIRLCDGVSRNIISKESFGEKTNNMILGKTEFVLDEAKVSVDYLEKFSNQTLTRDWVINFNDDSTVFDLVQRFRFKKEFIGSVELAGKKFFHTNSHINHMYKTNKLVLNLNIGKNKKVVITSFPKTNKYFNSYLYARDSGDEWVIHYRLLPKTDALPVLMLNHKLLDAPFPSIISKVVLSIKPIKDFFWFKGEKGLKGMARRVPINAYPMAFVPKGEKLELKTKLVVM